MVKWKILNKKCQEQKWYTARGNKIYSGIKNYSESVSGADPEILKGGCTKFYGPELPYSGFDPFLNLL